MRNKEVNEAVTDTQATGHTQNPDLTGTAFLAALLFTPPPLGSGVDPPPGLNVVFQALTLDVGGAPPISQA